MSGNSPDGSPRVSLAEHDQSETKRNSNTEGDFGPGLNSRGRFAAFKACRIGTVGGFGAVGGFERSGLQCGSILTSASFARGKAWPIIMSAFQ
jgi:hypothetical protein